jgi:hypothetical protein
MTASRSTSATWLVAETDYRRETVGSTGEIPAGKDNQLGLTQETRRSVDAVSLATVDATPR